MVMTIIFIVTIFVIVIVIINIIVFVVVIIVINVIHASIYPSIQISIHPSSIHPSNHAFVDPSPLPSSIIQSFIHLSVIIVIHHHCRCGCYYCYHESCYCHLKHHHPLLSSFLYFFFPLPPEWRRSASGKRDVLLQDEDGSTRVEGDYKRYNTLGHYAVPDGATLALVPRQRNGNDSCSLYDLTSMTNLKSNSQHRFSKYCIRI